MEDMAPALLEQIQAKFQEHVSGNRGISVFLKRMENGTATLTDVQVYSSQLGKALGQALEEVLRLEALPDQRLYWNIAQRTILPMLNGNYNLVNEAAAAAQKTTDRALGIGLNAVKATRPDERIKGLLDNACAEGLTQEALSERLLEPVRNCTESFFDDYVEANATFRANAGLKAKVIRVASGNACAWCAALAGTYDIDDLPDDIYLRHENCGCQVIFKTEGKAVDAHTKRQVNYDLRSYNVTLRRG